jgi:transposase
VAAVDGAGLPLAVGIASASPHEVKVVEAALDEAFLDELPERLIGDKAYDSDGLDERLWDERGVKLVAPHRRGRKRKKTQDGRELRRYRRRWKVERFFAWLHLFRRLVTRYERKAENFLGFLHLACALILLRQF